MFVFFATLTHCCDSLERTLNASINDDYSLKFIRLLCRILCKIYDLPLHLTPRKENGLAEHQYDVYMSRDSAE